MKLSAQEEYGLRCLLTLARHPGGSLTIPEIAPVRGNRPPQRRQVPCASCARPASSNSERGQHGGYSLARDASRIPVAEVLSALGGRLYDPGFCDHFTGMEEACQHSTVDCSIRGLWMRVQRAVDGVAGHHLPAGSSHRSRGSPRRRGGAAAAGQSERVASGSGQDTIRVDSQLRTDMLAQRCQMNS